MDTNPVDEREKLLEPEGESPPVMQPETSHHRFSEHLKALRPRQWTKNLIVFAVPLFAFRLDSLGSCFIAFLLFCCVSSGFYLLNDIADLESDRQHPVKCNRPIAAGKVAIPTAIAMAGGLLIGALLVSGLWKPTLALTLFAYILLQTAYNLKLKHKPIADIGAIATGFLLRAYAGSASTDIPVSPWFLLCTAMLSLFLAIEKRKAELKMMLRYGGSTRFVLQRYSLPFLYRMESTATTSTVMCYALWSSGPVVNGASTAWMLFTLPFVMFGIFRYQFLVDTIDRKLELGQESTKSTERPEDVLLSDIPILVTVISWVAVIVGIHICQTAGLIA
ncbi:decaprenyl-phosphate phosphoribosyltransferase [Synechococcus sp. PCC 7336]|uniref:decaprenyl-phosphate phosphoribosyltransferase n=1 Tax=Synechococcus sp. PCC 7336 TaxID=195250 RepID=UPI00036ED449|nr:decaprenyl-phosphate phosphoribosyltransferase [Synechococcus sp. PCC 7336]